MAPMLNEQSECEYMGINVDSSDEILEECLIMFFGNKKHDGTYGWSDENFRYFAYYDDDFVLKISKKRIRSD